MTTRITVHASMLITLLFGAFASRLTAPSVEATFPGKNGLIAFQSDRITPTNPEGDLEIFTMKPDGSDVRQLTANAASDQYPSWSADGTMIVFSSERDGDEEVYTMEADGSAQVNRTNRPDSREIQPAWSPDGTRIAFASDRLDIIDPGWEIFVMKADGTRQVAISNWPNDDWAPDWSPDGKRIAFMSERGGAWNIVTALASGAAQVLLTNDLGSANYYPSWSPDGKRIAFEKWTVSTQENEIYVMQADGSNPRNLTKNPSYDQYPTWSPDGTQIAFTRSTRANRQLDVYTTRADGSGQTRRTNAPAQDARPDWQPRPAPSVDIPSRFRNDLIVFAGNQKTAANPDGDFEIFVMTTLGKDVTQLTSNSVPESEPTWSPDGTMIAFVRGAYPAGDIYTMTADGKGTRRLTAYRGDDASPAWSPDGTKIAFARSYPGGDVDILVMNADGGNRQNITNRPGDQTEPTWSPDGKKIAFASQEPCCATRDIFVMNADGSHQVAITDSAEDEFSPDWAPRSGRIAYVRERVDVDVRKPHIWSMRPDGTGQRRVTSKSREATEPVWSPDGTFIAFHSYWIRHQFGIAMIRADGALEALIYSTNVVARWPDWFAK